MMKRGTQAGRHGGPARHVAGLALPRWCLQVRPGTDGALAMAVLQRHHRRGAVRQGPGGAVGVRLRRLRRTHAAPCRRSARPRSAGWRWRTSTPSPACYAAAKPASIAWGLAFDQQFTGTQAGHVRHGHDLHVRQHGRSGRQHVRGGASRVFGQVARGHAAVPASRASLRSRIGKEEYPLFNHRMFSSVSPTRGWSTWKPTIP